jgi:hypothetical protein
LLAERYDSFTKKASRGEPSEDTVSVMKRIDPKTVYGLKKFIQIVIGILAIIVFLKLDWKLRGPEAKRHLAKIEGELDELRPFPNALLMSKYPSVKTGTGVLDATYVVRGESPAGIEQWYKEEFGRLYWRSLSVQSYQAKRLLRFCRNGEIATLLLPEDRSGAKTEFHIYIGWGSSSSC